MLATLLKPKIDPPIGVLGVALKLLLLVSHNKPVRAVATYLVTDDDSDLDISTTWFPSLEDQSLTIFQ